MSNNPCRHRIDKRKYLVFPRHYKNYVHRRIRVWCEEVLVPLRPTLKSSWHNKSNVGLTAVL